MKEILISALNTLGLAFWVEVSTQSPHCTYYFGPFLDREEAEAASTGYVEDLESESAQGIRAEVKRCKPDRLTIYDDRDDVRLPRPSPAFSGQM